MSTIVEPVLEPVRGAAAELGQRIEAIEEAYEFMLAYAAQGRRDEQHARGPGIRHFLQRLDTMLGPLPRCVAAACSEYELKEDCMGMLGVLTEDARKAHAVIRFVLARETIGSQLIDNLNASIHLRALLTDLFILDESLKVAAASRPGR